MLVRPPWVGKSHTVRRSLQHAPYLKLQPGIVTVYIAGIGVALSYFPVFYKRVTLSLWILAMVTGSLAESSHGHR